VLACSDDALELVARNRARLLELGYLPGESDDRVVLAMLDKLETYRLATAAGVDVPRHFELADAEQLDAALTDSGVGFPCALKPLHSHLFARRFGSDQKLFFARDHGELVQACRKIAEHGLKMMVTEVVPGPEDAFHSLHTYLDENGQPLAKLTKRKLRQHPVGFGMGSYHVTDWNEEVADVALRFCTGVGVRGMANPEFKRDERDGRLKLIECNHRFTMSNELVRRVGLNLPLLAYDRVVGNPVTPLDGYRRGVYLWAPGEDIRAFREARRRGETTFAKWARSLMHPQHIAVLDRSDPGPAIASLRKRMAKLRGSR
jgi:predicted ATP-grasp superfamily ATP-dependent carboligase